LFTSTASEEASFVMGIKVCISRWITAYSCVGSGGCIVYNNGCSLSVASKVQVRGDIYAHKAVE
jgi:hypothetical protein